MRDWRNRQTRTFKGRVGDRVSSSLTSRTKRTNSLLVPFLFFQSRIGSQGQIGGILRLRSVAFANKFARLNGRRARLRDRERPGSDGIVCYNQFADTSFNPYSVATLLTSLTSRTIRTNSLLVLFYFSNLALAHKDRLAEYSACASWRSQTSLLG